MEIGLTSLLVVPLGLGLLGFIEPCSIGSTMVFIKHLEGRDAPAKLAQLAIFAITRALLIGLLGALAVVVGTAFLAFQKMAWIFLGGLYVLIGVLYVIGKAGALMVTFGPSLSRLAGRRGSASLGLLFGLNIPACAAPLVFALLGRAAAEGASGATLAHGFISLAVFGLGLSLPLVVATMFERGRKGLDWLSGLSGRIPLWTGVVLVAIGLWSIWLGLFVDLRS
jgi:cytochrome c-type biogenesis protein